VAEVAVALRMSPDALMRCDDEVLEALWPLAERARTEELWALEVAATTAELVHSLWRLTVMANSKKGTKAPPPLHVPRPWADKAKPRRVTMTAAELIGVTGTRG
jgi:hypothetical protein